MKSLTSKLLRPLLLLSTLSMSFVTYANEEAITDLIAHGEEAHKEHCYKCHTDDVYTRENHFVRSMDALSKQVVRCKDGNNVPWFDEDTDAVVQFLNKKYYKF